MKCEVWTVKCEVWSAKSAVCSVRCGVSREGHGRDRLALNYKSSWRCLTVAWLLSPFFLVRFVWASIWRIQ